MHVHRFVSFNSLIKKIGESPMFELERQAKNRQLKVAFKLVEKRDASLFMPTVYVVEVSLMGVWFKMVGGKWESAHETRRFQGMGNTTREAKFDAATNAILRMGEAIPGARYPAGDFPEEWLNWVDTNLLRGVDCEVIVEVLTKKGFHPVRNMRLMHRLICWNSLDHYLRALPEESDGNDSSSSSFSSTATSRKSLVNNIRVDAAFLRWIEETAKKGVDGELILEILKEREVDLERVHCHFAQKLKYNELGSLKEKNGQPAEILDFWKACKDGYLDEVVLFCRCNAPLDEEKLDLHSCQRSTPLMLAAMNGHGEVVKYLAAQGANVNAIDRVGRSALHYAAKYGRTDACAHLVRRGAMLFAGDFHGNTPLHLAAQYNHPVTVHFLAGTASSPSSCSSSPSPPLPLRKGPRGGETHHLEQGAAPQRSDL